MQIDFVNYSEMDLVKAATVEIATVLNWPKHVQLTMIAINRLSPLLRYVIIVISVCNYYYTPLCLVSPSFLCTALFRELVVVPTTLCICALFVFFI